MQHLILPSAIILSGLLVASLHKYALDNLLYFYLPWFDILMHFLGGIFISLFGVWMLKKYVYVSSDAQSYVLALHAVLIVFIVSLVWETFELIFGLIAEDRRVYVIDTIADFFMSTLGALFGVALVQSKHFFMGNKQINE